MVLAGLLVMGLPTTAVRADTTFNSGTTTVSTAQNFGDNLYIATTGTATLDVIAGGDAENNVYGYLGFNAGSKGTATVAGGGSATVANGIWDYGNTLYVGYHGAGVLNVSGGSVGTGNILYVGYQGTGTLNLSAGNVGNVVCGSAVASGGMELRNRW